MTPARPALPSDIERQVRGVLNLEPRVREQFLHFVWSRLRQPETLSVASCTALLAALDHLGRDAVVQVERAGARRYDWLDVGQKQTFAVLALTLTRCER